jgi:hypothetical protein
MREMTKDEVMIAAGILLGTFGIGYAFIGF